jgi:hypothetical protein
MIAPWVDDGKGFIRVRNAEETRKNARRSITNSLKEP